MSEKGMRETMVPTVMQREALDKLDTMLSGELFFGGGKGSGATTLIMMAWEQHRQRYGNGARGLMVMRTGPELDNFQHALEGFYDPAPLPYELRVEVLPDWGYANLLMGQEYSFLGMPDLTEWDGPAVYRELLKTLLIPVLSKVAVVSGTPGRPGSWWVKERFGLGKARVLATFRDNPHMEESFYKLQDMVEPELIRALFDGDWN